MANVSELDILLAQYRIPNDLLIRVANVWKRERENVCYFISLMFLILTCRLD